MIAAEQILFNRGFHELGRRTYATAWTIEESDQVVRITGDGIGSEAYFNLAEKLKGNPYMPVVLAHQRLPSNDHIALVEKLENPAQKHIYPRFREIRENLKGQKHVSESDVRWFEEVSHMAIMSKSISDFFMSKGFYIDIDKLPDPTAFREAATAITELTMQMYESSRKYVPVPDMNPTNILWRRTESGLHPVLYDAVATSQMGKKEELEHAPYLRRKLGMADPAMSS